MARHKWKLSSKQTEKKYRTDICECCGCERRYHKGYKYRLNNNVTTNSPVCVGKKANTDNGKLAIQRVINWVAFKDKYPPNYAYVLVIDDREQQKVIFIHNSTLDIDANMHLYTHWMHLPKPPCL